MRKRPLPPLFLLKVAFSLLVLPVMALPALGDEAAPSRTPWKATDPSSEKVVRWVVEGCAAYPVTEDAAPERSTASIPQATPKTKPASTN